jgi:geranylgeranyl diphosphate synthase, type II
VSGFDLSAYLTARRELVDAALDRVLPPESAPPPTLHRAMRYSVLAGGKRLRPTLVIAGAEAVGGGAETVLSAACALELIHTYSLIHDDLPAMDDDDYRRGRLTNHKVFGEAMAILAGDALLTLAFRLIADNGGQPGDPRRLCQVVAEVAEASGATGMVGGQVVDVESEGKMVGAETLEYIHRHKTAALIRVSVRAGAVLAGGTDDAVRELTEAGGELGLAFQIVDDILDVEGDSVELGKTVGSDQRKQKATYPAVHGVEASRRQAWALIDAAKQRLAKVGPAAAPLSALADFIVERRH